MTPTIPLQAAADRAGIQAMIASCAFFSVSDSMVKLASDTLPAGEIMAIRGVMGTAILLGLALHKTPGLSLNILAHPVVILRGLMEGAISVLFVFAIAALQIGDFTAIMMSSPLIITALSVVFLRTNVGLRRWIAIACGFVGVMLVAKPGAAGFAPATWLAIGCSFLVATRDLITRQVPAHVPSNVITLVTSAITTLTGFGLMFFQPFVRPQFSNVLFLALAAFAISAANMLIIMACRQADISTVSPFRYAIMPFALMAGFLIWGNVPDNLAIIGILLIVGSGLYAFHRERIKARRPSLS